MDRRRSAFCSCKDERTTFSQIKEKGEGRRKNASRWRQKSRLPLHCRVRARFLSLLSSFPCYHHLKEYGMFLNLSRLFVFGLRSGAFTVTHHLDHPAVKFVSQTLREADATALCYVCKNVGRLHRLIFRSGAKGGRFRRRARCFTEPRCN